MKEKNTNEILGLSAELIKDFDDTLTKSQKNILLELLRYPNICQKKLADNLNTSPNSLSNLLKKLRKITPPLLQENKQGKHKYFMLTTIGKRYAKEIQKERTVHYPDDTTRVVDTLNTAIGYLKDFAEISDTWELDLILLLSGQKKSLTSEFAETYKKFIQLMYELRKKQLDFFISFCDNNIDNSALNMQLKQFIETNLEDYFILEPLFLLEENNEYGSSVVIDTITSESNLNTSIPSSEYLEYISKDDYCPIYVAVTEMIKEAKLKNYTKKQAYTHWTKKYHISSSQVLLQIAEKYEHTKNR